MRTLYAKDENPTSNSSLRKLLSDMRNRPARLIKTLIDNTPNPNTGKNYVQCLLKLGRKEDLPETVIERLGSKYDEMKADYQAGRLSMLDDEEDEGVICFPEILNRVKERFGEDSYEYLMIRLYRLLPVRDNFGLVKFDSGDETNNIKLLDNGKYMITVEGSKNKFTRKPRIHAAFLDDDTVAVIQKLPLKNGEYVFRPPKGTHYHMGRMSAYIKRVMKAIGIPNGNINYIRRSYISECIDKDTSASNRIKVARSVGHLPQTSALYRRKSRNQPTMTNAESEDWIYNRSNPWYDWSSIGQCIINDIL